MWTLIHMLEPAAWMLLGVSLLLALPRMAGARGGTLLKIAGVLGAIGFSALSLMVYAHGEAFLLMTATDVDPTVYAPLFEQFEVGLPMAALPSLLGRIALLLAVVGLVRAGTVPVWAALPLLVPVVMIGSSGVLPLAVGLTTAFGPAPARLLLLRPSDRRRGRSRPGRSRPGLLYTTVPPATGRGHRRAAAA